MSNKPNISISKIGIVVHDYTKQDFNNKKDFSYSFGEILTVFDEYKCDSVLFSLYTINTTDSSFDYHRHLNRLKNVKIVFVEEFDSNNNFLYHILYKNKNKWYDYPLKQKFGSLKTINDSKIYLFLDEVKNERNLGNFTVLLCGESNIVKYSMKTKEVEDIYSYFRKLDDKIDIILNPIHDKMTRFEMRLKRKFLSKNKRLVISVWNKGKLDKNGKLKDGSGPAWNVFYDEKEFYINCISDPINSLTNIEMGIVDFNLIKRKYNV